MTEKSETRLKVVVERAVRPIVASARRKKRIREELLGHLTAIFDDEMATHGDEQLALKRASERFGSAPSLAHDLQKALPRREKWAAVVENRFGRRTHESATRYTLRLSALLLMLDALLICVVFGLTAISSHRFENDLWYRLRVAIAFVLVNTADTVAVGLIYFQLRGAICGGLGFEQSLGRAVGWAIAIAAIAAASLPMFYFLAVGSLSDGMVYCYRAIPAAVVFALFLAYQARFQGSIEIEQAGWERLDTNG